MVNLKKIIQKYRETIFLKQLKSNTISLSKADKIFRKNVLKNIRIVFNYFNYICENKHIDINRFEILDIYFDKKELLRIRQKKHNAFFSVNNIAISDQYLKSYYFSETKVSIIMTTYNSEKYIRSSLCSLLNQTYLNSEIILVDDGSTDNTYEILNKFKQLNSKEIKLIKLSKNYGTYVAKNIGITYADGDLITFHDSDDWAHPQRIEEHVKAHAENKYVKFTISKLIRLADSGCFYAKEIYPLDRLSMVSLMIDSKLITEIGYFRTNRLGSDTEYFERLKKFTNYKWKRIDKVLMFCAYRNNSLTTSIKTGVEGFARTNKRKHFWNQWNKWHNILIKMNKKPYMHFDRSKYDHTIL